MLRSSGDATGPPYYPPHRRGAGVWEQLPGAPGTGTEADLKRLASDQTWFLPAFLVEVALGLVAFAFKTALGLLFFAAYAVYFWREIRGGDESGDKAGEALEPLKLQPRAASPTTWTVVAPDTGHARGDFFAPQLFVHQLDAIGPLLGLSAAVTALLLSPIATELPAIMNAVIWVRQGKTQLALANISGAMMIRPPCHPGSASSSPAGTFDHALLSSGLITVVATVTCWRRCEPTS